MMKLKDPGKVHNQGEERVTADGPAYSSNESKSINGRKTIANKILNRLRSGKTDNGSKNDKKKVASSPDKGRLFRRGGRAQSSPTLTSVEENASVETQLKRGQSDDALKIEQKESKGELEGSNSGDLSSRVDGTSSNSNQEDDCDEDDQSFVKVMAPPAFRPTGANEVIVSTNNHESTINEISCIPENDSTDSLNFKKSVGTELHSSLPLVNTSVEPSSLLKPSIEAPASSLETNTAHSPVPLPPKLLRSLISSSTFGDQSLASLDHPLAPSTSLSTLQRSTSKTYAVKRTTSSLSHYQTTPIEKHYELSNQILTAFESHYTNEVWLTAYRVGLQFIEIALLEIPKHGYYRSSRHERERMQCNLDAARVAQMLSDLLLKAAKEPDMVAHDPESLHAAGLFGNIEHIKKLEEMAFNMIEQASSDQECRDPNESSLIRLDVGGDIVSPQQTSRGHKDEPEKTESNDRDDWVVCEVVGNVVGNAVDTIRSCSGGGIVSASKSTDALDRAIVRSPEQSRPLPNSSVIPNSRSESESRRLPLPPLPTPLPNQRTSSASELTKRNANRRSFKSSLSDSSSTLVPPPPPALSVSITSSFIADGSFAEGTSVISIHSSDKGEAETLQLEKALFLTGLEVSVIEESNEESNVIATTNDFQSKALSNEVDSERVGKGDLSANNNDPATRSTDFNQSSTNMRISCTQGLLELKTLAAFYYDDFVALQVEGRVRIKFVNTYQGRIPESTNGCAVIAPLICIHHLLNDDSHVSNDFLPDFEIQQVVDCETPSILKSIRQQLRLSDHAFLIPSDVHDYLLAQGQLCQSQFLNVTGGNILDESHLHTLIELLDKAHDSNTNVRIAATFFFHEHVVAILKVRRRQAGRQTASPKFCYEFVDSLPFKAMLRREHETDDDMFNRFKIPLHEANIIAPPKADLRETSGMSSVYRYGRDRSNDTDYISSTENSESTINEANAAEARTAFQAIRATQGSFESYDHLLFQNSDPGSDAFQYFDDDGNTVIIPRTVRIRCFDGESLEALLRWYACSVFTNENVSYINQYSWNDAKCDFDPRVFQAFIWSN